MAYHEECKENEIFVGNIYTSTVNKETENLTKKSIKFRIGKLAYDIHGKKLSTYQSLPLFIDKESHNKYDNMMMAELSAIRR